MAKLPKLKVIDPYWGMPEEIRDFEQGKYLFPQATDSFVVVEGQMIWSYEELIQLAAEERHKDKEFLEVRFVEMVAGG